MLIRGWTALALHVDMKTKKWHSFPGLSLQFDIRDIESTNNAVWFATNRGLLKFDRDSNYWRLFTKNDGLLNNNIYHIDHEEDFLWLSTEDGVTIFQYNRRDRID